MNDDEALIPIPRPKDLVTLALEKGAAIDVIERIAALVERRDAIAAKKDWAFAVAAFKADCPPILKKNVVKDKNKEQLYKFASYDDIKAVTVPLERRHGIVTGFTFDVTTPTSIKAILRVTVGSHTEEFVGAVPVPQSGAGGVNATQLMGQAQSYVKRYLYIAAFDLVVAGEDSDAVGLIEKITPEQVEKVHDAIDACRKTGSWNEDTSFAAVLRAYEIEYLGDLPADRVLDLLADLDRQRAGRKAVRK